jgi:hypothetical protein
VERARAAEMERARQAAEASRKQTEQERIRENIERNKAEQKRRFEAEQKRWFEAQKENQRPHFTSAADVKPSDANMPGWFQQHAKRQGEKERYDAFLQQMESLKVDTNPRLTPGNSQGHLKPQKLSGRCAGAWAAERRSGHAEVLGFSVPESRSGQCRVHLPSG